MLRQSPGICQVATPKLFSAERSSLLWKILQLLLLVLNSAKVGLEYVKPQKWHNGSTTKPMHSPCCYDQNRMPGSRRRRLQPKPYHRTKGLSDCLERLAVGDYFLNPILVACSNLIKALGLLFIHSILNYIMRHAEKE